MRRTVVLSLAAIFLSATPLHAEPALIAAPDYPDSFTIVAEPRGNPGTLGVRTRDGYPVFPTVWGGMTYIEPRGERIPILVPVIVTGPVGQPGQEIPGLDVHDHPMPAK